MDEFGEKVKTQLVILGFLLLLAEQRFLFGIRGRLERRRRELVLEARHWSSFSVRWLVAEFRRGPLLSRRLA